MDSLEYVLHALVLDRNPEIAISREEFCIIRLSKAQLSAAFALEEIFDLLIANFRELEIAALSAAIEDMTTWKGGYEDFFEIKNEANRRTLNFLSAARLYIDQFPQWLREIGADPASAKVIAQDAYDTHFGYRFMEALRNHVRHAGMAVHGATLGSKKVPQGEITRFEFNADPFTLKSYLAADKKFKKTVLAECPEKIPILPAARVYVGDIARIHEETRRLALFHVQGARRVFESAIVQHQQVANRKIMGLTAISRRDGTIIEQIPIFLQWDDVRLKLESRNRSLSNLDRRYVTSHAAD